MKLNKLLVTCLVVALSSSLFAVERSSSVRSYLKAMKKLEKKTVKTLRSCNVNELCVDTEYKDFEVKRENVMKYKLHIRPRNFKQLAKRTLMNEYMCILNNSKNANACFEKSDEEITKVVNALT